MIVDKAKVLIVEDDAVLCMLASKMVEEMGHEVVGTVSSGESALQQIPLLKPDILVSDIHLDGAIKGTELIKGLREAGNRMPAILFSGESDAETIQQIEREKGLYFLLKPISFFDFKEAFEKLISLQNEIPHLDY
ncbi:MAG: response regulator [Balneola sp.]|nr:MAG: response regulator [Balneola sp.]